MTGARHEEPLELHRGLVAWITLTLVTCGHCGCADATMQCGVQGEDGTRVFCHPCGKDIKIAQPLPEALR